MTAALSTAFYLQYYTGPTIQWQDFTAHTSVSAVRATRAGLVEVFRNPSNWRMEERYTNADTGLLVAVEIIPA